VSSVTSITTAPVAATTADHVTTHTVTGRARRTPGRNDVFLGGRARTVKQVGLNGDAVHSFIYLFQA